MKYRKLIVNRILVTVILILIQFAWVFVSIVRLTSYSASINILLTTLSVCMILVLVNKDDNPSYRMIWMILIALFPLFGGLMYVFAGDKKPSKRMNRRIKATRSEYLPMLVNDEKTAASLSYENIRAAAAFGYVTKLSGYPVYSNTSVRYYSFGEDMFGDMVTELEKAEHYIFMEYFILGEGHMWSTIQNILVRKAGSGVKVRIIYDDLGCVAFLPYGYWKQLESLDPNISCMAFNPVVPFVSLVMNNRDHRKMLVIDGKTAFTGGINISDEYINITHPYGIWKDTGVMLKGDAVISFTEMFLEIWNTFRKSEDSPEEYMTVRHDLTEAKGYVQPFYDTPLDREPLSENVYIDILSQAKSYVYIFTPYLIIDDNLKSALTLAAKRGVDVRIITPGIPDKKAVYRVTRANYLPLLRAGVRIFEYTPGFIHAKSYVSDDTTAVVGTINMDYRSLYLHFECGMMMYGNDAVLDIKRDSIKTMEECREITLSNFHEYYRGTMFDSLLRILAPML